MWVIRLLQALGLAVALPLGCLLVVLGNLLPAMFAVWVTGLFIPQWSQVYWQSVVAVWVIIALFSSSSHGTTYVRNRRVTGSVIDASSEVID